MSGQRTCSGVGPYRKKGVRPVHCDEDSIADESEVHEIAPANQPKCDNVVHDELNEVFTRFFNTKSDEEELLAPVCEFKKVGCLHHTGQPPVRILWSVT